MLKEKSKTIILGIAFILIWVLVGSRTIKMIRPNKNDNEIVSSGKNFTEIELTIDTFSLKYNYKTPFVFSKNKVENNNITKNKTPLTIKSAATKKIIWPKLSFYGIVESKEKQVKTGLFKLNDKDIILKEGEQINKINILKIWRDSSLVSYKEEQKTLIR